VIPATVAENASSPMRSRRESKSSRIILEIVRGCTRVAEVFFQQTFAARSNYMMKKIYRDKDQEKHVQYLRLL